MSRAFVKEHDDDDRSAVVPPVPPEPRPITPQGLAELRRQAAAAEGAAKTDLETRLDLAVVPEPPEDRSLVAFGARVRVSGASARASTFTIAGEDELDVAKGKIGVGSPLGLALLGRRVDDEVVWHRPAGDRTLKILSIDYAPLEEGAGSP